MTTVNEPAAPILPVKIGFWWNENGPSESFTYDGDDYPYVAPEPASRYIMKTTLINSPVTFYAIYSKQQEEEAVTHPKVEPPAGVEILEYFWDFGDGTQGFGPIVSHNYHVLIPGIEVRLTVVDSRGIEWSHSRPLNLASANLGFITPFRLRALPLGAFEDNTVGDEAASRDANTHITVFHLKGGTFKAKLTNKSFVIKGLTAEQTAALADGMLVTAEAGLPAGTIYITEVGTTTVKISAEATETVETNVTFGWPVPGHLNAHIVTTDTSETHEHASANVKLKRTATDEAATTEPERIPRIFTVHRTAAEESLTSDTAMRVIHVNETASDTSTSTDAAEVTREFKFKSFKASFGFFEEYGLRAAASPTVNTPPAKEVSPGHWVQPFETTISFITWRPLLALGYRLNATVKPRKWGELPPPAEARLNANLEPVKL